MTFLSDLKAEKHLLCFTISVNVKNPWQRSNPKAVLSEVISHSASLIVFYRGTTVFPGSFDLCMVSV